MAGRNRHSAEDIARKLRRAEELAAEGKAGEIAAELRVSALYNWRRGIGGMDPDAAKELKELRSLAPSRIGTSSAASISILTRVRRVAEACKFLLA